MSQRGHANGQAGAAALIILLILAVVVVVVLFVLVNQGIIENPIPEGLRPFGAAIKPAADYKNPLDAQAQYTNPFAGYKNPFDNIK